LTVVVVNVVVDDLHFPRVILGDGLWRGVRELRGCRKSMMKKMMIGRPESINFSLRLRIHGINASWGLTQGDVRYM
jgi:hypothetical protein